ncbi:MAG: hypothetical protein IID34_18295, partial [Planctomycetes bacterium]|nr:hypothetical protein [Planctomycetota bacterium]
RALENRGRRAIAYSKFDEALRKNPLNHGALGDQALWKKKEYFENRPSDFTDPELLEEAKQLCGQALALSPDEKGFWNLKSVILYSLGELKEAEAACRRTLELDEDYVNGASNLAKVLAMQGRLEEALAAAKRGTAVSDRLGEETKYDDGVWLTLGTLQLYLQDPEALDSIQRAKKIGWKDVRNRLMLARAYLTLGKLVDTKLALEVAKNTVAFAERYDPRYSRILAHAFLVNVEYADASRHAYAAVQGGDLVAFGRLIGAIAEAQMGNTATAQKYVDQALASWPEAFASGERVLVTAEKGLLWFDTAAELEGFRDRAQQLIQTHAAAPQ